ncbi:MAG: L-alanine-DL-glutamate epimerase-like enolase superfamily enzyme [Cryomorphaceae bacterium]|jgi:L-alanine-DL-glutamate epimerase-like enolase superfamily enzyme
MKINADPYRIDLKRPFRLATGSRNHTNVVYIHLSSGPLTSVGEASLPPYLGESIESVVAFANSINPSKLNPENLEDSRSYLDGFLDDNLAAKAGIEMALVSMAAKMKQQGVGEFFGITDRPIETSYTIGISEKEEMKEKLAEAAPFKTLKLKLGSADDLALLRTFREMTDKPFSVDVNQGWGSLEMALPIVQLLEEMNCLFIEQPFHAEDIPTHAKLKEMTEIPIFADESIKRLKNLREHAAAFDGVVVKLMKSTGPIEAVEMLREAKQLGLKTVMGCMAESSVSVAMARAIAPLADYADLDGPFLIKGDPYGFVIYEGGKIGYSDARYQ